MTLEATLVGIILIGGAYFVALGIVLSYVILARCFGFVASAFVIRTINTGANNDRLRRRPSARQG